jgi:alkylation response protein AidB-like acyl-CoA dehydrogenase
MQRQLAEAALNAAIKTHLDPAAGLDARAAAASSVKARASEAAPAVCATALQLHGAIGFTDEYDLGFYLNRALTLSPWLGTAAEHRRRFIEIESRQL